MVKCLRHFVEFDLGEFSNFSSAFCAFVRTRSYREFFFLNVSLLATLRAFDWDNFPLPKKIFRISQRYAVSCCFILLKYIPSRPREDTFADSCGNAFALFFAERPKLLVEEEPAFDRFFANSLALRSFLKFVRRRFRFGEIRTVVFREICITGENAAKFFSERISRCIQSAKKFAQFLVR